MSPIESSRGILRICQQNTEDPEVLVQAKKASNGSQEAGGLVQADLGGLLGTSRQAGPAFSDGPTDRLYEAGVRFEKAAHRLVSDFKNFSLVESDDISRTGFTRKQTHFAE